MKVSIIISTCNRREDLRQTLAAMAHACVPEGVSAELIVVDNGPSDETAKVITECHLPNMPVRYLAESARGLSRARNQGLAAAQGDILLFTDDDVRPPRDWIAGMCRPILSGEGDAVAGGVVLSPALRRPWMQPLHAGLLASTEHRHEARPETVVGANMAFSRQVLGAVPLFDEELGAGTRFGGEEALFSFQLRRAGFRIVPAYDVAVAHHFEAAKLRRDAFLERAEREGRWYAYLMYHWEHESVFLPEVCLLKKTAKLALWRLRHRAEWAEAEGMAQEEMEIIMGLFIYKQYLIERKRPRNYDKHGLVKRQDSGQ